MKYHFVSYMYRRLRNSEGWQPSSFAIYGVNPVNWFANTVKQGEGDADYILLGWREITKEEFEILNRVTI